MSRAEDSKRLLRQWRNHEKMTLKTAYNINPQATRNIGRGKAKERGMKNTFRHCESAMVHLAKRPEDVVTFSMNCLKEGVDISIIDSGDGGVAKFMTNYFRQLFRKFGKGMTPPEFARIINSMALDPKSGLYLPAIYHNPEGGVNCYGKTLGMDRDMENVAENIESAEKGECKNLGRAAFRRMYVPTIILYPADNPSDLERVHIMTLYADTSVYDFFEKYDDVKDKEGASMITAMRMLARCAGSITISTALDMVSEKIGRKAYYERYIDEIIHTTECAMSIDGNPGIRERSVTAIGTMGVSLYGLKPFWRMPNTPEGFTNYNPGFLEDKNQLGPEALDRLRFHLLCGKPKPLDIVLALPDIYAGRKTNLEGVIDRLAKRVEITEKEEMEVVVDGSRHTVSDRMVMQIAYMQPFIDVNKRPGSI